MTDPRGDAEQRIKEWADSMDEMIQRAPVNANDVGVTAIVMEMREWLAVAPPSSDERTGWIADCLRLAIRQNSNDILLTGDEIRRCEQALASAQNDTGEKRCDGFMPGADPGRCLYCGARAEDHARRKMSQSDALNEALRYIESAKKFAEVHCPNLCGDFSAIKMCIDIALRANGGTAKDMVLVPRKNLEYYAQTGTFSLRSWARQMLAAATLPQNDTKDMT